MNNIISNCGLSYGRQATFTILLYVYLSYGMTSSFLLKTRKLEKTHAHAARNGKNGRQKSRKKEVTRDTSNE